MCCFRLLESRHLLTPYQVSKLRKGETDSLVLGNYKLLYRNASGSFARVFRGRVADRRPHGRPEGAAAAVGGQPADRAAVPPRGRSRQEADATKKSCRSTMSPARATATTSRWSSSKGATSATSSTSAKSSPPIEATRCLIDLAEGLEYAAAHGGHAPRPEAHERADEHAGESPSWSTSAWRATK